MPITQSLTSSGVVENARDEKTRSKAVEFFKEE